MKKRIFFIILLKEFYRVDDRKFNIFANSGYIDHPIPF